jgi:hypothetical protein
MEFTNYIPSLQDFINLSTSNAFSKKEITLQSQCAIKAGYSTYDQYLRFQYFIILNTYSLKGITEEVAQLSRPNLKIKFSEIASRNVDESIEDELKPILDNTLQFSDEERNSILKFETKIRMLFMECFIDNMSDDKPLLNTLKLILIDAKKQFVLSDAETKNEIQDLLDYIDGICLTETNNYLKTISTTNYYFPDKSYLLIQLHNQLTQLGYIKENPDFEKTFETRYNNSQIQRTLWLTDTPKLFYLLYRLSNNKDFFESDRLEIIAQQLFIFKTEKTKENLRASFDKTITKFKDKDYLLKKMSAIDLMFDALL